jgi:uncharacterized protein YjdB
MRAITTSRLVTVLVVAAAVGCTEPFDTPPSEPSQPGVGLTVVPSSATIISGQVVALTATMRDQFGDPLAVAVKWKSSNEAVATVAANGEVLGRSAGVATVTADAQGKTQTSGIRVLARPPKPNSDPVQSQRLIQAAD